MNGINRMLDANINRASEGLRVLKDIARFSFNIGGLTGRLKTLRHSIRKDVKELAAEILEYRDSDGDIGPLVSIQLELEGKGNVAEAVAANFKRAEEALRSVEEALKVLGNDELSRKYEESRYLLYSLEKEFNRYLKINNKLDIFNNGIYCLTGEEYSLGRDNIKVVAEMLDAGIRLIQYREKSKTMLEKYRQCVKIREMTDNASAVFIINDHTDLATSVCADGVHLGQDDLPVQAARQIVGNSMIIGVSTHCPEQAEKAVEDGADYIGVGPIFKTSTKKDVCEPVGIEYLDYAVANIHIPFVAIGGIKLHNLVQVKGRGAKCIAMVTEIVGAEDIKETIKLIKKKWEGGTLNELQYTNGGGEKRNTYCSD
ncbi:MAG: thiamine phosphate synthase [Bacillota bacterium]